MRIKFFGARGAFPSEVDQMVSFGIFTPAGNLLVDMGSSSVFSDIEIMSATSNILISHTHHDHVAFVPHFLISRFHYYRNKNQEFFPCSIISPEPLTEIMSSMGIEGSNLFAVSSQVPTLISGYKIDAIITKHPRKNYCYKIQHENLTIVYTGDTAFFTELSSFCKDVDLLICEASYSDASIDLAINWGHMTPKSIARLIKEADPKITVLTHFCEISSDVITSHVVDLLDKSKVVIPAYNGLELNL